ncbi:MAG: putative low-complexity protein [Halioglobus sp.]|jgi:uncharacterized low-complexity protein
MANLKNPLAAALGAAFLATAISPLASAEVNPFSAQQLTSGYDLTSYDKHAEGGCGEDKAEGEGKCGEGKCGEGKAEGKAEGEGKCGEGKCGEGKAEGEGSCGGDKAEGKAEGEGKCGEGKCGGK